MSDKNENIDPFDTISKNVISSTECTGLFQIIPKDDEQVASYDEIYDIPALRKS